MQARTSNLRRMASVFGMACSSRVATPKGACRRMASLSSDVRRRSLVSNSSRSASSSTNLGPTARMPPGHRRPSVGPFAKPSAASLSSPVRALSSYDWKNMSKQAQEANKKFAKLSMDEIRKAGEAEVDKVEKALKAMEPFNDDFTVRREGLEVFAELPPHVGTYWIKFDTSINQICMMSPRSGPHRYIYDGETKRWIGEADKHDFEGMLTRDIIQSACGIPDF